MSVYAENQAFTKGILGPRVDRPLALLPQTGAHALYTVAGGRIALIQLIGEVTTVIHSQTTNAKLIANPTTGSSVDMCIVLDIDADEVGCLYGITGLQSDALIGINAGVLPGQVRSVILPIGTLDFHCAASSTGAVKWSAFWVPIDVGAVLTAA